MPTKLRWGVLSTAAIGLKKVIPAMQQGELTHIAAIASRDHAKAEEAARTLGIEKIYGSYEDLLADPQIDVIYNPLPNHLHVPWTIKAAEAGKHVLCEKPLSLNVAEARALLDVQARTKVKIGEAFMVRTHPQWLRVRELIASGHIGFLRSIQGFFSYNNVNPANVGTHYKGAYRVKFIAALLTRTEGELAATIARYRALKAVGMDALHESTREHWRRQVHAGNVRPDEPDPVSEHLTYAYRGIGDLKGRLEVYRQLLDDLERDGRPLLHWKD